MNSLVDWLIDLLVVVCVAVGLGHVDARQVRATWPWVYSPWRATLLSLRLHRSQYERLFLREVLQDTSTQYCATSHVVWCGQVSTESSLSLYSLICVSLQVFILFSVILILPSTKAGKMRYYGHFLRTGADNLDSCLGECTKGRPQRGWIQDIADWTGLGVNEAAWFVQDEEQWRKCVRHVANPPLEDGHVLTWPLLCWKIML